MKRSISRRILPVTFTGLLFFMFTVWPKASHSQSDSLNQMLLKIQQQHQLAGLSVVVVKNGTFAFSKGYGLRDRSQNLPVNDSTIYRIASISKTITATAMLQLYEKGRLKLDEDASSYLGFSLRHPKFATDIITVRMLLTHTSSLRDGNGYDRFLSATYSENPPPDIQDLIIPGHRYYTSDMWAGNFRPATHYFTYANINFGLLGTIVEKVSGQRFDIYCRENILTPLGITGSYNIQDIPDINQVAVLYRLQGSTWMPQAENYQGRKPAPRDLSQYIIGSNAVIFAPQGGLRISANDLAKFLFAQLNHGISQGVTLLADTTVARMQQPVWIDNGSNGDNYYGIFKTYSLGMHRTGDLLPGEILYGHPGEAYGLISDMYFSVNRNYGIIFITNGGVWKQGTRSGWYDVEEKVFSACLSQLDRLSHIPSGTIYPESGFKLYQNQPNPFNTNTCIAYYLPVKSHVKLDVFDL